MIGLVISVYLALGGASAVVFAVAVGRGLDRRDRDPKYASAMGALEHALSVFPGGMPAVLVLLVLLWPSALVYLIVELRSRNRT